MHIALSYTIMSFFIPVLSMYDNKNSIDQLKIYYFLETVFNTVSILLRKEDI